jgi:hypothetical protein
MLRVIPAALRPRLPLAAQPLAAQLAAALLALLLPACGSREVAPPGEPWPLTLQQPGVVSYTAIRLPAEERDAFLAALLGDPLAGLDADRPLVALHVDPQAFGGSYALLLPVRDGDGFLQALGRLPGMTVSGRGQHQLEVGPDTTLGRLMLMASGVQGAASLPDLLEAFERLGPQHLSFHVRGQDGWMLLAPTFEAASACADVLAATGGFAADPPRDVVLSLDLERVRLVHAEPIRKFEEQLKGLIGGVRTAGLFGVAARMGHGEGDGGGSPLGFDVNWEVLWALKDMLDVEALQALQVQLQLPPAGAAESTDELPDLLQRVGAAQAATLRVRCAPGSPLHALVGALRPAPELPDATLVLAADGPAFARAFAEWTRPLAEVVKGEGPPCDRYVDELASILSGFGGTLALQDQGGDWCLLAQAGDSAPDALGRLGAWLAPLLATARLGDLGASVSVRASADGRTLLVDADGEARASVGRTGDVLWLRFGDQPAPAEALAAFGRALAGPAPPGAPCLRLHAEPGDLELRADGAELHLALRRAVDG